LGACPFVPPDKWAGSVYSLTEKNMASNYRKNRSKVFQTLKSDTINVGFSNIDTWVDMGNFAMNRVMSGSFKHGLLFGRQYVYYGESGSGKSLQAAYVVANAQRDHKAAVLWIDIEKATDGDSGKQWLTRAGVDVEHEDFMYMTAATLGNAKELITKEVQPYKKAYLDEKDDLDVPLIIVVDSWSAAMTDKQWKEAQEGTLVGDMGQKAKQTGDVVQSITHLCSHIPVMVLGIGHIMDNQDMHGGKHKTTGGHKMFYMASGCLMLTKKELKAEDSDDKEVAKYYEELKKGMPSVLKNRTKQVIGHKCVIDNLKSRAAKPHQRIEIQVPFNTGMDPCSGLMDLLIIEGAITVPSAGWYQYGSTDIVKFRKKDFKDHAHAAMAWADELNPQGIMTPISKTEADAEEQRILTELQTEADSDE
jgi:RecA/RadA recombinase